MKKMKAKIVSDFSVVKINKRVRYNKAIPKERQTLFTSDLRKAH